ncbi:MAG: FHA domain-containing protein [Bacillaceae bacterium]
MEGIFFTLLLIFVFCFAVWVFYVSKKSSGKFDVQLYQKGQEHTLELFIKGEQPIYVNIEDMVIIGCDGEECDVVIVEDIHIAPKHCYLLLEEDGLYIRPVAKGCRTYVNGIRIEQQQLLQTGDIITVGNTVIGLRLEGEEIETETESF